MTSVAQVTSFFSQKGGVERAVRELSAGLVARDYNVTVVCTQNEQERVEPLARTTVLSAGSSISIAGRPLALGLGKKLNSLKSDIVHFHLPFPLATLCWQPQANGRKKSITIATWHHDIGRYPAFQRMYEPQLRTFLNRVDRILVTSPQAVAANRLLQSFDYKCEVVPLGVNAEPFRTFDPVQVADVRARFAKPIILFVGRLVYYKGCEVLLEAMKDLNATLIIAGEGPLKPALEKQARDLNIADRVFFVGRISDEELVNYYHACDVFALPSTLPTECFGLVQVEAMLCGKPVVNTALNTGVAWVSRDRESGLTVAPNDAPALAAALKALVSDNEMRLHLGNNARRRALENFTVDSHVKKTSRIYEALIEEKHRCLIAR